MQKYNLQKKNPLKKETKILQDITITLELISSFNTSQNISSFKNPHIKKIDLYYYYYYYYYLGAKIP
jgi:hypothetical protein